MRTSIASQRFTSVGALALAMSIGALGGMVPAGAAAAAQIAYSEEDAPTDPLPTPDEGKYSVGQAVQLRVNADGTPNGQAVDYRWSVTQVTVQGQNIPPEVPVPEQGNMLRSLQTFNYPPQDPETGTAMLPVEDFETYGTARTVSLVPQDFDLPLALETAFTLDGEPISAEDLVGKDGVVTATYTVKNLTGKKVDVPITSVSGEDMVEEVTADVPMVAEATTLLPQRFTGLNLGKGLGGADGRGNTMAKWIALPFAPINADSQATFGWAANVTNAVIPSMIIQVLPVYIPETEEEEEPAEEEAAGGSPFPPVAPPNTSDSAAQIQAGLAQFVQGIQGFANKDKGEDPLTVLERRINRFFVELGINLRDLSASLNGLPPRLDQTITQIEETQAQLTELVTVLGTLDEELSTERIDDLRALSDAWPRITTTIVRLNAILPRVLAWLEDPNLPIYCAAPNPDDSVPPGRIGVGAVNQRILEERGGDYQGFVQSERDLPDDARIDDAYTFGRGLTAGGAIWRVPEGGADPEWITRGTLPSNESACNTVISAAESVLPSTEPVENAINRLNRLIPALEQLGAIPALSPDNAAEVQRLLRFISDEVPGILTVVTPLLNGLGEALTPLRSRLDSTRNRIIDLSNQLLQAGEEVGLREVDLPLVDELIDGIVTQVMASPNGQLVTGGLDQTSAGISALKAELSTYVGNLVASAQTGGAVIKSEVEGAKVQLTEAGQQVNTLKAEVGGMALAAHQSPLPYGGDPESAPTGTQLSGAYEFRVDAADTEAPATAGRIVLGLLALIVAGLLGGRALRRPATAAASEQPQPTSVTSTLDDIAPPEDDVR